MNVKELKEFLNNLPDEMEVVLQSDPEGNSYSPLQGTDNNSVWEESSGICYSLGWTHDEACLSEDEWDEIKKSKKSLILYPKY